MECCQDDSKRCEISLPLRLKSTMSEPRHISLHEYLDWMLEPLEPMKKSPALQVFKEQELDVQMFDDHCGELCPSDARRLRGRGASSPN